MTQPSKPTELFTPEELWKETLLVKVRGYIPDRTFSNLERCGKERIYRTCKNCRDWETFFYRCDLKFCPLCNWRIARDRAAMLRIWTTTIAQPKHVVLTCRNFDLLTRRQIRSFARAFAKLRRAKVFEGVKGGCVSIEITNESRGWHLHAHVLVDARWIDAADLAITWGRLVGQQYAIVKIKDCRGLDYCNEVTKYVVKGAELVTWHPELISQFIHAISGVRFFSTFGSLFKMRRQIAAYLAEQKPPSPQCHCGCCDFWYQDEAALILREAQQA